MFPGAVALVWRAGAEVYHEAHGLLATHPAASVANLGAARETVYDLASLTKVLATTTLAAIAVSEGRVSLDAPVPAPWSRACPGARLGDLLSHSAGLEAHREYFAAHADRGPTTAAAIVEAVCRTPPAYPVGERSIYSDLGFIILGAWLERLFEGPLDRVFADRVAWPLGLDGGLVPRLGFQRLGAARGPSPDAARRVAPTEVYDPALHPEGVPTHFALRRRDRLAHHEVHDDNAFVMGGVAGHAGLFGDAEGVLAVARAWLEGGLAGLEPPICERFWRPSGVPGSTRCLGWDGVSPDGGSTGGVLGGGARGHLGFTGTSLWIDPDPAAPRVFILLANRVHPTRTNAAIVGVRQDFHRLAAAL